MLIFNKKTVKTIATIIKIFLKSLHLLIKLFKLVCNVSLKLIYEALYELYRYILEDPFESFWFECIGIIMGYLQILLYLIDKTVNK